MHMKLQCLTKNRKWTTLCVMALATALLAGGATDAQPATSAQNSSSPQSSQPSIAQPLPGAHSPQSQTAPKVDPAEDTAYKSFYELRPDQSAEQIKQGEAFLLKYPDSPYRELIYSRLTQAHVGSQDFRRMEEDGAKALALNPDDVDVLATLAWAIPHSYNPDDPQAAARLQKAQDYGQRALQILATLSKPDDISAEDFERIRNDRLSEAHSGLGLVDFRRGRYAQAVSELQQSVKLADSPDPTDLFILGISLGQLQRYEEAAAAYDQCGKVSNTLQTRCQAGVLQARKEMAAHPAAAKQPASPL
jgi:tetratricopeptide (TPR) repeat protein